MSWKGHVRFWGEKGGVIQFPTYPTNKGNINKIENNKFNNNTPANFIIEENKIKLVQNDGFISIVSVVESDKLGRDYSPLLSSEPYVSLSRHTAQA